MRWSKTLQLIDVHAEGEIGRIVTGGQPFVPGRSISEKFANVQADFNTFRKMITLEPRGAAAGSVVMLFPPENQENHVGLIVLQPDQAHAMSGSNAICTTTALLETGMVEMSEGKNQVRLETAAGLVTAHADCADGKCQTVTLSMPASYVAELEYSFNTSNWGLIKADIAFGGVFYAIIDADQLGLKIEPATARLLSDAGMAIKAQLEASLEVIHPENPLIRGIAYVMFRQMEDDNTVRTATTMWPGRLDRSPCGTGNSANLAVRAAKGEIQVGETYRSLSTIGSEFMIHFSGETQVGNYPAVLPQVSGRGWIYGMHQIGIDPSDPFSSGFALTDTWGADAGKL
ncbi:MAG: proline racemase family protein [Pseudomonadota bacterium]